MDIGYLKNHSHAARLRENKTPYQGLYDCATKGCQASWLVLFSNSVTTELSISRMA